MNRSLLTARNSRLRWLPVSALLAGTAGHLPVIRAHLQEAPYMGVLFILLSAAFVVLAGVLISWDAPVLYAAAIITCSMAILGYAATRLVGFPMLADDVGNWLEPSASCPSRPRP
jgi:hypothetical protein